ncbi:MAG: TonB-dependent receptor plug domain-containing protein [Pseudomonadota bacterium]|nr:TonB-dependent receptor plug domain-containing protein [Pseudomonadota bacterium]
MFHRFTKRHPLTAAIMLGLCLPALATAQQVQDEQTPAQESTGQPATSARALDTITVTGSRISRAGFDTLEPAQVIARENIEQLGMTNVADAIFRQPGFSASASTRGAQSSFGTGVSFVSRFGLGSNRELTLVNGRRFVTSNPATSFGPAAAGLQVDLNVVPTALIQRVESIGIGGAPTYGSDAITGVTNIILRKDFEGVEASMGIGATDKGDNIRFNISSTFGQNFADGRGNFTITAAHDRSNGVLENARDYYRQGWGYTTNPNAGVMASLMPNRNPATDGRYLGHIPFDTGSGDGIPGTILVRDFRFSAIPSVGCCCLHRKGAWASTRMSPGNCVALVPMPTSITSSATMAVCRPMTRVCRLAPGALPEDRGCDRVTLRKSFPVLSAAICMLRSITS